MVWKSVFVILRIWNVSKMSLIFRLLNIRSGLTDDTFNPLDSKCDDFLEICCRLPEWKDVPLEKEILVPPRPPVKCIQELTMSKGAIF